MPARLYCAISWFAVALAGAFMPTHGLATETMPPLPLVRDEQLSAHLHAIVAGLQLDGDFETEDGPEQISLAVIDCTGEQPRLGGVNPENFIYPASVYKMYVAAEVLRQVEAGEHELDSPVVVRDVNAVDRRKEISSDPRPLLEPSETVTVGYLLDLMITRSDNSAANCLIDLAQRPRIDAQMHRFGWRGSEVTRKFLKRAVEDPRYADVPGTETCALHAAEFLYRIRARTLHSPWVSMQLESLLGRQLDKTKLAPGLPRGVMYYHKTGWYAQWTHDVGIVDDGQASFVVACFLPVRENELEGRMATLGREIYALLRERFEAAGAASP